MSEWHPVRRGQLHSRSQDGVDRQQVHDLIRGRDRSDFKSRWLSSTWGDPHPSRSSEKQDVASGRRPIGKTSKDSAQIGEEKLRGEVQLFAPVQSTSDRQSERQNSKAAKDMRSTKAALLPLNFDHKGLAAAGAKEIATVLRLNTCLVSLLIYRRASGRGGARDVAHRHLHSFSDRVTVTSLDLHKNRLEEGGARELATALRRNTTLVSLNIFHNWLEEPGGRELADVLRSTTTLTSLHLGYNALGEDEEKAKTLRFLQKNTKLTFLELACNGLGEAAAFELAGAMRDNSSLTDLSLRGFFLSSPVRSQLEDAAGARVTFS